MTHAEAILGHEGDALGCHGVARAAQVREAPEKTTRRAKWEATRIGTEVVAHGLDGEARAARRHTTLRGIRAAHKSVHIARWWM